MINKKKIYLGTYISELDAANAYDIASKKYHNDFAFNNQTILKTINFQDYPILERANTIKQLIMKKVFVNNIEFLTIDDAANYLKVKNNTIVSACSRGNKVKGHIVKYGETTIITRIYN